MVKHGDLPYYLKQTQAEMAVWECLVFFGMLPTVENQRKWSRNVDYSTSIVAYVVSIPGL